MLRQRNPRDTVAGFTIAEALVVVVMAGILAAIAAPSWLAFLDRKRVSSAQDQALQAMRSAQAKAIRQKQTWEAGFRQEGDRIQWSVHIPSNNPIWQDLLDGDSNTVKILESSNLGSQCTAEANYCVRFQDRGSLDEEWFDAQGGNEPIGQITFTTVNDSEGPKRCVVVATILGSLQTGRDDDCN
ncbi:prepilin-type cleavage/methylation domain-containing protein [Oscillatoriales cyanobacterium LEGE 11467]|uniref:Prepilin-type cleavage/methylation domain-containing protein n=1 Tax=Zarconia navalis LEGE 11467 TaxID=1828826 RepID=A0A928VS89_9CYAN|nr:hypothetical protein [Zarconia navalis]MBE9039186.1 prepilin-type cleavage/methylation domain-containing protein [Zarconia navalis LEGE 11467]